MGVVMELVRSVHKGNREGEILQIEEQYFCRRRHQREWLGPFTVFGNAFRYLFEGSSMPVLRNASFHPGQFVWAECYDGRKLEAVVLWSHNESCRIVLLEGNGEFYKRSDILTLPKVALSYRD